MSVFEKYYEMNANTVIKALEKRNMYACYAKNKEDALQKAMSLIEEGKSISWGGSESVKEIGLINELYKRDKNKLLDRSKAGNPEEANQIMHEAFFADYYLMSSNAVTLDGELVNIDGNANRLAALLYGPKNIIMIVGMNKIVKNVDEGLSRIRNYTAPLNAIRLGCDTPCGKVGHCCDCTAQASMCCQIVTTRFSRVKDRIKIILVGEELGY
jgi:L-lactate utilization protein LutC